MNDISLKIYKKLIKDKSKDKSFVDKMNKTRAKYGFKQIKLSKQRKYCFGQWLDTCFGGFDCCHTCKDLEECKDKFIKSCKSINEV